MNNQVDINEQEEQDYLPLGVVLLDENYYFKVDNKQYIFGKITEVKDKASKNFGKKIYRDLLYPSTIEGVLKLYFKHSLADRNAGTEKDIRQFKESVDEVKLLIKGIAENLGIEKVGDILL